MSTGNDDPGARELMLVDETGGSDVRGELDGGVEPAEHQVVQLVALELGVGVLLPDLELWLSSAISWRTAEYPQANSYRQSTNTLTFTSRF